MDNDIVHNIFVEENIMFSLYYCAAVTHRMPTLLTFMFMRKTLVSINRKVTLQTHYRQQHKLGNLTLFMANKWLYKWMNKWINRSINTLVIDQVYKNPLNEPIYKHLIIFISGLNHLNISKKININLNIPFLLEVF